jgi:hypothetical protein
MGNLVYRAIHRPDEFEHLPRDGPDDWKSYARAIVRGDRDEAKALATKLMPLAPDCPYPAPLRPFRRRGLATT